MLLPSTETIADPDDHSFRDRAQFANPCAQVKAASLLPTIREVEEGVRHEKEEENVSGAAHVNGDGEQMEPRSFHQQPAPKGRTRAA